MIKIKSVIAKPRENYEFVDIGRMADYIGSSDLPPVCLEIFIVNSTTLLLKNGKRVSHNYAIGSEIIEVAGGYPIKAPAKLRQKREHETFTGILHELHAYYVYDTEFVVDHNVLSFTKEHMVAYGEYIAELEKDIQDSRELEGLHEL